LLPEKVRSLWFALLRAGLSNLQSLSPRFSGHKPHHTMLRKTGMIDSGIMAGKSSTHSTFACACAVLNQCLPLLTATFRARWRCIVYGVPFQTWQALAAKMSPGSSGMAYGRQKLQAGYMLLYLLALLAVLSGFVHPTQHFCMQLIAILCTL